VTANSIVQAVAIVLCRTTSLLDVAHNALSEPSAAATENNIQLGNKNKNTTMHRVHKKRTIRINYGTHLCQILTDFEIICPTPGKLVQLKTTLLTRRCSAVWEIGGRVSKKDSSIVKAVPTTSGG